MYLTVAKAEIPPSNSPLLGHAKSCFDDVKSVTNRMKNSGTSSPYDREEFCCFYILRYKCELAGYREVPSAAFFT